MSSSSWNLRMVAASFSEVEAARDSRVSIWNVRNVCETNGWIWICVGMVIAILTVSSGAPSGSSACCCCLDTLRPSTLHSSPSLSSSFSFSCSSSSSSMWVGSMRSPMRTSANEELGREQSSHRKYVSPRPPPTKELDQKLLEVMKTANKSNQNQKPNYQERGDL